MAVADGSHSTIRPSLSQGAHGRLPIVGETIDNKFKITQVLGQGGMGAVFAAVNLHTGREIALKWLLPEMAGSGEASQRFLQEAKVIGAVRHPNVIDIFDMGATDGALYLVMERLYGIPLNERISQGPMTAEGAANILVPVLDGLAAAHAKGVVHRDLKPANIFLCSGSEGSVQAKVLDFGISKITAPDGDTIARLTAAGTMMGTPAYMSIEQIKDSHTVDVRTDVYACGVMLFEMVTGMLPFKADNFSALVMKIAGEKPLDIREVAPGIDATFAAIVTRAMARNAEDRFATISELRIALSRFTGKQASASSATVDPVAFASTAVATPGAGWRPPGSRPLPRMEPTARAAVPPTGITGSAAQPSVWDAKDPTAGDNSGWETQQPGQRWSEEDPITVPGQRSRLPLIIAALVAAGGLVAWLAIGGEAGPTAEVPTSKPAPKRETTNTVALGAKPAAAGGAAIELPAPTPARDIAPMPGAVAPAAPTSSDSAQQEETARKESAREARRAARHERRELAEATPPPVQAIVPQPPAPRLELRPVLEAKSLPDATQPAAQPATPPPANDGILRRSGHLDIDQF